MKEKLDSIVNYIEEHLQALIFLAVAVRILAYLLETIRRWCKR